MAEYVYRHECVWKGYRIVQQQIFAEPRPTVECPACGVLYTLGEVRTQKITWSVAQDPESWGSE
jgi:hypothetical protein